MNTIQIKEHTPFKNSIYEARLNGASSLVPYLNGMTGKYRSSTMTNCGGWQSPSFNYEDHEPIQPVINIIKIFVSDLYIRYSVDAKQPTLTNYWVNINPTNSYNLNHNHAFSYFSTVLYCKVPLNSGELRFERPDELNSYVPTVTPNELNYGAHIILPQENTFVMFPSHLKHSVGMNRSSEKRISIAFNWR
jgi:uncharacterized protein (TIGR02466 family)